MTESRKTRPTLLRLSAEARANLERLAERWHADMVHVADHALDVLADPDLVAALGGGYQAAEQGLRAWASLLERAAPAVEELFDREEWNYLADSNNGCSPLFHLAGGSVPFAAPLLMVAANAEDAQRLDGAGERWFGAKEAGKRVRDLVKKLAGLDAVQGWCVVVALQWFWEHSGEPVDPQEHDWWRLSFRRGWEGAGTRRHGHE